jgi:LysR family transcriptional regulator, nod-box dependent transcriptional activator
LKKFVKLISLSLIHQFYQYSNIMRLNGFDLNQLVSLDALLRERSVSRAAEKVHISQSAMSWVLAQLRQYFSDPLLVRSGRGLVLTPFAKSLAGPVGELLGQAHALTARTPQQAFELVDRELKIAASDYILTAGMADAIKKTQPEMPNLRFDVLPLSTDSARLLALGEIDLLCAGQSLDVGQPPNECIFEDQFTCLACTQIGPPGASITLEDYLSSRHVVLRYFEHQLTFEDEEAVRRMGLKRQRQIAVWSASMVPQLITGTPMIATVAERIARPMTQTWPLKILPFPLQQDPVRVYAYWHESRNEDSILARFMEIFRDVLAAETVE